MGNEQVFHYIRCETLLVVRIKQLLKTIDEIDAPNFIPSEQIVKNETHSSGTQTIRPPTGLDRKQ